jgi:hypothetical protein
LELISIAQEGAFIKEISKVPPEVIPPYSFVEFGSFGKNLVGGTNGNNTFLLLIL